ncbi:MAG: rhodanese-like domain-containing protein [Pseudomonadota bacterium]
MKRLVIGFVAAMLVFSPAWGYDKELAEDYAKFFSAFNEKEVPKALKRVTVEKLVKAIKAGEKITILDVRTKAETGVFGFTYKDTLVIPMNQVFMDENLARIPTDHKVIVACQKGLRSTIINLALRNIGYQNTYSLKGGFVGLVTYLNAKHAF